MSECERASVHVHIAAHLHARDGRLGLVRLHRRLGRQHVLVDEERALRPRRQRAPLAQPCSANQWSATAKYRPLQHGRECGPLQQNIARHDMGGCVVRYGNNVARYNDMEGSVVRYNDVPR